MAHFTGLVPAVHTPMAHDGSLHLPGIERLAEHLVSVGAAGCFACGTTGEGTSLTVPERMQVVQRWVAVAGKSLRVVAHVGHTSVEDARDLAGAAQRAGAYAVAAMAPPFIKAKSVEDLVATAARIASGAPDLPFYYYHIPSMTGANFLMREFAEVAVARIPNFVGLKYTHSDFCDFGRCLDFEGGRLHMLFGLDEMLLAALATGATAMIGSTYGFAAPLYQKVIQAFQAGDLETARCQQARSREMVAALVQVGLLPALKAAIRLIGVDCGPVRLPLVDLTSEQYAWLERRFDELGILDDCRATV